MSAGTSYSARPVPLGTPRVSTLEYRLSTRAAAHAGIACAAAKAMSEAAQVTAYSRIKMVDVTARLIASANYAKQTNDHTTTACRRAAPGGNKRPALGGARWVAAAAILATLATLTLPTTSAALLGCNSCKRCNAYNAYNVCNTPWARAQCSPNRSRLVHASHSCRRGHKPNARGNQRRRRGCAGSNRV